MMTCEHEKVAARLVKSYLTSMLHQKETTLDDLNAHSKKVMDGFRPSLEEELYIISDALDYFTVDDVAFFVDDITGIYDSKDKSIAWNLVGRAVFDFFSELQTRHGGDSVSLDDALRLYIGG